MTVRLGVLVSARASLLRALDEAARRGNLGATIEIVIANREESTASIWATGAGLRTSVLVPADFPDPRRRYEAMRRVLEASEVDLVILADWDEASVGGIASEFTGRPLTVYRALLPAFADAIDPVAAAIEYGVKVTGCTVYFVTDNLREGPIILQRAIDVRDVDTPETLAERIELEAELALVEAVRWIAQGRLRVDGRLVRVI